MSETEKKDVVVFGPANNMNGDSSPWIGQNLVVIPFDSRMEAEAKELSQKLAKMGYFGFRSTREALYTMLLTEDYPR